MPSTVKGTKYALVVLGLLLLSIAAVLWYRFWLPAGTFSAEAKSGPGLVQTVTVLDSADQGVMNVVSTEAAVEPSQKNSVSLAPPVSNAVSAASFDWQIPAWLPPPPVPEDNPMSEVKVSLGRHLFYDTRLSEDNSVSCASCHHQELGFTDGLARSVGVGGSVTERSAMGLANVGYSPVLTWANPHMTSLERQSLVPLFSEEPVEMGLAGKEKMLFATLQNDPLYKELFHKAFPERDGRIELASITRALAAFQRTLISVGSPYDRYKYGGDKRALSESALRGETLFFSEKAECYHCHQGFNFTDTLQTANSGFAEVAFYNTGLYNLGGEGGYPDGGHGLHTFTDKASDMGKFRTQSLRNVGVSAPYFHDGSAATLDDVIDHYAEAGRTLQGRHEGVGSMNPFKDSLIVGFDARGSVKEDLKAFLHSLTDTEFLSNPRFSNPWPENHPARGAGRVSPDSDTQTTQEIINP